jgi:Tol biopolymer transport system component
VKLERFDLIVVGVLGLIGLGIGAVLLIGDQVGARVVSTQPEAGGQVSAFGHVVVEFGQDMNQASVESALTIDPPAQGKFIWQDKTVTFIPSEPFQRGVTYTARLGTGAASDNGQQVKQERTWQFSVREAAIIYVAPASEARELWVQPLDGEARAITATNGKLYDFAVSPTGERIVFTMVNEQNGIDIWIMNRDGSDQRVIVDCGGDRCTVPDWSPDETRLAYSREGAGITPQAPRSPPRVWVYDFLNNQTTQLYSDTQLLGYGPSWSPDGRRIAAWDGSVGGIRVVELASGDMMLLKSQSGMVGTWSPDGATMLYNELSFVAEQTYVKMFMADFATKQVQPAFVEEQTLVDYSVPVWAPSGEWIAAGIKTPSSGLGTQLWVMRPDGSEGFPVADELKYTYGSYRWNAWSDALVFQRYELELPFAKPEVMLWSKADNTITVLATDASMPTWLP